MARILPKPHVLQSIVNQNLNWAQAIAEFVDNSFDADAQRVVITYRDNVLTIEDDGRGVKDLLAMVTLGMHDKQATTKLGMYGVGAKEAWLWCGPAIEIETVHGKQKGVLRVDYRDVANRNWECDDPTYEASTDTTGTRLSIKLGTDRKRGPTQESLARLSWLFSPALERGKQILFVRGKTRQALEPLKMPALLNSVRSDFHIDGKSVSIDIGVLPQGERLKYGPFWLRYGHRVICDCSLGAGQYSTFRMGGTITLGEGWKLTKNKDDLSENADALAEAIFVRIEHALKAGETMAQSIETSALRIELEAALNEALTAIRPKRGREKRGGSQGQTGTVIPKNSGRERLTAAVVEPEEIGKAVQRCGSQSGADRCKTTGFNFDFCELDASLIGKYERIGNRVSLNVHHPWIAEAKQTGNKPSLYAAMCVLIAEYASTHDGSNKLLSFDYGSFSEAFGKLMLNMPTETQNARRQAS